MSRRDAQPGWGGACLEIGWVKLNTWGEAGILGS